MSHPTEPFDLETKDLLIQLADIDLSQRAQVLELEMKSDHIIVPLFGRKHLISSQGIMDPNRNAPTPAVSTVLLHYILRNAAIPPLNPEIISFRDLKGAGPLVVSFANNTNHLIASTFAGRLDALESACRELGGEPDTEGPSADLFIKFQALPGVLQYLSFNDQDDDFPAQCQLLFQRSAENYLDLKSLFVLGTYLAGNLIKFH